MFAALKESPYTGRPPYEIRLVYGDPFPSAIFSRHIEKGSPYTGRPPYEIRPVYGDPFPSATFSPYEKNPNIPAGRHMRSGRYMGILFLRWIFVLPYEKDPHIPAGRHMRFGACMGIPFLLRFFCHMKRIPIYRPDLMRRPDTGRSTAFPSRLSNGVHSGVAERCPAGNRPAITNDTYLCGSECSAAGWPRLALGATRVSIVCDGWRPAGQGSRSKSNFCS